jgi:hypothetical protein
MIADGKPMATRKRRAGCTACADAYVTNLARRNGATDDEISAALGDYRDDQLALRAPSATEAPR